MPDPVRQARSKLAHCTRYGNDPASVEAARRELTAAKIERAITDALADAPGLSASQREYLARLLQEGPFVR